MTRDTAVEQKEKEPSYSLADGKMARGEENEGGVKEKIKEEGGERSRCRRCQS